MGEVWIRTINNSLVRADRVTEIASTRASLHDGPGLRVESHCGRQGPRDH